MRSLSHSAISGLILAGCSLALFGFSPPHGVDENQGFQSRFVNRIKNWGLVNNGRNKSDIDVMDAWKITSGSNRIVVAVIDTGLDANHRDIAKNVWHDPNDKTHSTYGWNFVDDRANPNDEHGHGTHVAGIIGAVTDLEAGVSGVAQHVSIMPVKYYSDANPGPINLRNTVRAINYAVDHGARIINYSGGGPEFAEDEYLAIKRAEAKGVLFVAAAGNEHQDTDMVENYYYPSAYRLSNIISVAAIDINNNLLPSSNWGRQKVDVAAPGENIFSTLPGGRYGYMSGTSQATAFVTGMAALLLSKDPTLTPQKIRELIIASVDHKSQLEGRLASSGKVNAYNALLALSGKFRQDTAPALVASRPTSLTDLIMTPSTVDNVIETN